jgi:hypothetical protein
MYSHLAEVATRHSQVSTRPGYAVVTGRATDTQLLPHDRDYPQASLVLRGRVQDWHHPVGGYLPSYLGVGASLQKVYCRKQIHISLTPVKTTIVLIWAFKRILTTVFENRTVRDILYP